MSTTERRHVTRLSLRLPVLFRRRGAELIDIRGTTRDVSADGVYALAEAAGLRLGDVVEVELKLPPTDGVSPYETTATSEAEVVRIESSARGIAIAVRLRTPIKLTV